MEEWLFWRTLTTVRNLPANRAMQPIVNTPIEVAGVPVPGWTGQLSQAALRYDRSMVTALMHCSKCYLAVTERSRKLLDTLMSFGLEDEVRGTADGFHCSARVGDYFCNRRRDRRSINFCSNNSTDYPQFDERVVYADQSTQY